MTNSVRNRRAAALALLLTGAGSVAATRPAAAQIATPAAACANGPAIVAKLDAPLDGATGVTTQPKRVQARVTAAALPLQQLRVVLVDGSPYATEAGLLTLDASAQGSPPEASSGDASSQASYVETWVPPLKANTHYDVRIVLASDGNCTLATIGSFTTGSD